VILFEVNVAGRYHSLVDPYMEELLRVPKKGDALLPNPNVLERFQGPPAAAFAISYRMAAQVLVKSIRGGGDEAFLFYPVVFLYRHHVELMLKNLIVAFDDPGVQFTQASEITEAQRTALLHGHSLQKLWDHLRPAVQALGNAVPTETIEGVNHYIQQLNEIDPGSTNFRYATKIHETKAALESKQRSQAPTDLRAFACAMECLSDYLGGLDSYVSEMSRCYYEMSAEAFDDYASAALDDGY
jgi:hypothetical protein